MCLEKKKKKKEFPISDLVQVNEKAQCKGPHQDPLEVATPSLSGGKLSANCLAKSGVWL